MSHDWTTEDSSLVDLLCTRLNAFYNDSSQRYPAFEAVSRLDGCWSIVASRIAAMPRLASPDAEAVRVLEFGAGRTGFPEFLGAARKAVHFTAQDVTSQTASHLRAVADHVHLGDLSTLHGSFDVIFSTFVWEHIARPRAALDHLLELLAPGGSLFLFSPRYDVLGYVPPALRHLPTYRQVLTSARLQAARWWSFFTGESNFFVVTDPALFHAARWFQDSDAVHLVSRRDLRNYLRKKGLGIIDCWPKRESLRYTLLERLLKLCVEVRKPEAGDHVEFRSGPAMYPISSASP